MHYVYILQNLQDNSFYIGYSANLKQRLREHNQKKSTASKSKAPYKLIFNEAFLSKTDALNKEKYLKTGYGRRSFEKMLKDYFGKQ